MRVLVTTSGSAGHFLPLVPFARACAGAGHDVRVAAQRSPAAIVERTGLPFAPFDDRPPEQFGPVMGTLAQLPPEEANVRMVSEVFGRIDARGSPSPTAPTASAWALDDPGPEVINALPDAVRRVLDDPGYREAARRIAAEMAALPPVEDAVGVPGQLAAGARDRVAG